jgi:hypothetical protein
LKIAVIMNEFSEEDDLEKEILSQNQAIPPSINHRSVA